MNVNPNQPDPETPEIDEALLDEALAQATPEELEAKILALTDPTMLSLLDEAMAPEAPSDQLTQRILAATQANMQPGTVQASEPVHEAGVLARIGPSTFRYAAAAAIALAVGLGVWFANQDPNQTDPEIVRVIETPGTSGDATADDPSNPDWLAGELADSTDFFESDFGQVSDSIDDATISRDSLWSELDAYEDFLADIES